MTVIDQARGVDVEVHEGAGPLPAGVLPMLDAWLPDQRWYPIPGHGVTHVPWCTVVLASGTTAGRGGVSPKVPSSDVVVPLLRLSGPGLPDPADEAALVIQVPLVLSPAPAGRGPAMSLVERSLIGVVGTSDEPIAVYDGGAHPAAWFAYLTSALPALSALPSSPRSPVASSDDTGDELPGTGPAHTDWLSSARPLGTEQSNSSVLVPGLHPPIPGAPGSHANGVILKILRTVPLGPHPDVVIPEALTRAGWTGVPRFLGAVEIPVPAHLAVVSELITHADDGFELARDHAATGRAFDEAAAQLGVVVADMHRALERAQPSDATLDPSAFMGVLRRRAAEAISDVAELAPHRAGVTSFYDEVSERLAVVAADRPIPLQAIHGDLHLGQVLHARDGWKVLDFEGEPQRPVAERTAPDLPLRDVAGLLRSFDYAAAVGDASDPEWSADAQLSFLEGYREEMGAGAGGRLDLTTAALLLRALTLDKALYEVVYESRHRPAWLHIPLTAVARTLDR